MGITLREFLNNYWMTDLEAIRCATAFDVRKVSGFFISVRSCAEGEDVYLVRVQDPKEAFNFIKYYDNVMKLCGDISFYSRAVRGEGRPKFCADGILLKQDGYSGEVELRLLHIMHDEVNYTNIVTEIDSLSLLDEILDIDESNLDEDPDDRNND